MTGYIVALLDDLPAGTSLQESAVKDAKDVLDVVPLVTPELLQLTAGLPIITSRRGEK